MASGIPAVWDGLVGQDKAVAELSRAVAAANLGGQKVPEQAHAMTHAWLISGPPGSGRSDVARAFAAALQCPNQGCGQCHSCRTVFLGTHPDVIWMRTEKLSIGIDAIRTLVRTAALRPSLNRFQVVVIEDADRMTPDASNALLKGIEEPAPKTVWVLCAPTADDMIVTVQSRCRKVHLVTPAVGAVSLLLQRRDRVPQDMADWAARVSQGHIGRARWLATESESRQSRQEILSIPGRLTSLGECLAAADELVRAKKVESEQRTKALEADEKAKLQQTFAGGKTTKGIKGAQQRNLASALKQLEDEQKARAKRYQRDALDQVLTELTTWYRDLLVVQFGVGEAAVINADRLVDLQTQAANSTQEDTIRKIHAILDTRKALDQNVTAQLAFENLMVKLGKPANMGVYV